MSLQQQRYGHNHEPYAKRGQDDWFGKWALKHAIDVSDAIPEAPDAHRHASSLPR